MAAPALVVLLERLQVLKGKGEYIIRMVVLQVNLCITAVTHIICILDENGLDTDFSSTDRMRTGTKVMSYSM
jgi:hypothetical protein